MSDDENNVYTRTSLDRYLYGHSGTETQESDHENASPKQRSKSTDVPKTSSEDFYRKTKTKLIERGVKISNQFHNLVGSQNSKLANEKEELNELNQRLDKLVDAIKHKKSQNEELEQRIHHHREHVLANGQGVKRQLEGALDQSKRELNQVSEQSSVAKIRASRSMYDLNRFREKYDEEMKYQTSTKEKIRTLENQRAQSLHELSFLRENYESRQRTMMEDANKNERYI
jgi:hypothetical protein